MEPVSFQPDIVVTNPYSITLVIEAKVAIPNVERTEERLKEYMVGMRCPVGLLITPERLRLYRDTFSSRSTASVLLVGEYNANPIWQQPPPAEALAFERFVQSWLEDLGQQANENLPGDLRQALRDYVLPAVMSGDVRAAHPRYS